MPKVRHLLVPGKWWMVTDGIIRYDCGPWVDDFTFEELNEYLKRNSFHYEI